MCLKEMMRILIRKGRCTIVIIVLFLFVTLTLHYFLNNLSKSSMVTSSAYTKYEALILHELSQLRPEYYKKKRKSVSFNTSFLEATDLQKSSDLKHLWQSANNAVSKSKLYQWDHTLGLIIQALRTARIIKADYYSKGTQFKFNLSLEGDQSVLFKPRWYEIDKIFNGAVYSGRDRFQAEILAFYLSAIFNKALVPISIERTLHVDEILAVATPLVLKSTLQKNGSSCFIGSCLYCVKNDPICPSNGKLQGAVIFNYNIHLKRFLSPWKRLYKNKQKAKWEVDDTYCETMKKKLPRQLLLDIIDIAIFDFLLQNGDRHTYELYEREIIWIDNGKGLGNPRLHHIDILAPLYQCCLYRGEFIDRLKELSGGAMTENLKQIPELREIITEQHFNALEDRLLLIFATIEYCRNKDK